MHPFMNRVNPSLIMACAYIAADVYLQNSAPKEPRLGMWNRLDDKLDWSKEAAKIGIIIKDFFARIYGNDQTGEVVIAYRGTDPKRVGDDHADWDIGLMHQSWSDYDSDALAFFDYAKNFIRGQRNSDKSSKYIGIPIITGHSLGGYLAQIVSYKNPANTICVAFNAPNITGLRFLDGQMASGNHTDNLFKVANETDGFHLIHNSNPVGHNYMLPGQGDCATNLHQLRAMETYMTTTRSRKLHDILTLDYDIEATNITCVSSVFAEHAMEKVIAYLQKNPAMAQQIDKDITAEKTTLQQHLSAGASV